MECKQINEQNSLQIALVASKKIFIPQDFIGFLRLIVSSLALLSLLNHALEHEFSDTLEIIIKSYDGLVVKLMSPLSPFIESIVVLIKSNFNISIEPQYYWRHLFLILGVYFFSRLRAALSGGRWLTAIFRLLWGVLIGLMTALLVSSVHLSGNDKINGIAISILGVLGILLYELGVNIWFSTFLRKYQALTHNRNVYSWREEFINLSLDDFLRAFFAMIFCIVLIALTPVGNFPESGVFTFGVVILLYGFFWIYWASKRLGGLQGLVKNFSSKDDGDASVGLSIINIFMWTIACVALDSGSQIISESSFI